MAYPTVSAPYGLKPTNLIGGRAYAGSTRMVPISNAYGYNFFYGDVVRITNGVLAVTGLGAANSAEAGTIGIFQGCQYTNPTTKQLTFSQYWPASTAANDALAFIVDDTQAVFQTAVLTQSTSSVSNTIGTTIGYISPAFVGSNAYLITNGSNGGSASGNTTTGDSVMAISGSYITGTTNGNAKFTSSAPFRIVQLPTASAVTVQATGSSSSSTITLSAANTAIQPGMQVICTASGATNAAPGNYNYVTAVTTTSVTVANATGTVASGSTFTFVGYPEALVAWNFGYHSYQNATGN